MSTCSKRLQINESTFHHFCLNMFLVLPGCSYLHHWKAVASAAVWFSAESSRTHSFSARINMCNNCKATVGTLTFALCEAAVGNCSPLSCVHHTLSLWKSPALPASSHECEPKDFQFVAACGVEGTAFKQRIPTGRKVWKAKS